MLLLMEPTTRVSGAEQDISHKLHPLSHWLRRLGKLVAALLLIPPVLLLVFLFFSAWKLLNRCRG